MKGLLRALLAWWYALHYWGGLFFFLVGIGLLQVLSILGLILPVGPRLQHSVQTLIRFYLRGYLCYLNSTRALRSSFSGWKAEFSEQPGIIVANHPSMLDAPFFLSRLPRGICIFKAALGRSILRGRAASIAGYMDNEDGVDGLRAAVESVKNGSQFLFFPEGTRTPLEGAITLRSLYAVVAKYAQVPIHIFAIEHDSNALRKEHPLSEVPRLPATFRVRFVQTVSPDAAPTAAKLHEVVASILLPLIEAYRRPAHFGCYSDRTVVEESVERVEWTLRMPPGPGFFAGHFPGHPIAPGAASVHWIEEAWSAGPGRGAAPAALKRVRFFERNQAWRGSAPDYRAAGFRLAGGARDRGRGRHHGQHFCPCRLMSRIRPFILIPSYNTGGALLRRTVEGALTAGLPVRVMIDGSTDGSERALDELLESAADLEVWKTGAEPGERRGCSLCGQGRPVGGIHPRPGDGRRWATPGRGDRTDDRGRRGTSPPPSSWASRNSVPTRPRPGSMAAS